MPGTPMDREDEGLAKLQIDNLPNGQRVVDVEVEHHNQLQQQYRPDPTARELTQTDKLNKRLLESLLKRMSKSDGEFDRFMVEEENTDGPDEESSDF